MFILMLTCNFNVNAQEASPERTAEAESVIADVLDDAGEELQDAVAADESATEEAAKDVSADDEATVDDEGENVDDDDDLDDDDLDDDDLDDDETKLVNWSVKLKRLLVGTGYQWKPTLL